MSENTNTGGAVVQATANTPQKALVPATVAEIKQNVAVIQQALRDVMKNETHYGKVPGCGDKKVLLKPGAEVILTLFHIGAEPVVEEISDGFDVRYRTITRGFYIPTGQTIGYGIGEASTSEKKYKWRAAVCDEEFNDTPETRRQVAWIKSNGKVTPIKQVRQNPADILNTVLKMSKKRALVDLCLTATACSDIFVQDLDDPDINDAAGAANDQQGRYQQPRQKPAGEANPPPTAPTNVISEPQRKRLYAIGKNRGLTDEEMGFIVFTVAGVKRSDAISRDVYDAVVEKMESAVPGKVLTGTMPAQGSLV